MLEQPSRLAQPMAKGDSVAALENGRDLAKDDLLQIDSETMLIVSVMSPNNYQVKRDTRFEAAHAVNAIVYQLPAPYKHAQLNARWIDPNGGGWRNVAGIWQMGAGI